MHNITRQPYQITMKEWSDRTLEKARKKRQKLLVEKIMAASTD